MTSRCAALLALALLLACELRGAAPPGREGLDLVVLVDQSGSMTGAGGTARNDRHGLGHLLAAFTLELVATDAGHHRVRHRLGVVSFGSSARVDLPLSEVVPESLARQRRAVAAIRSKASLGTTDFVAALGAAARLFQELPPEPGRRRAILLITDGVPSGAAGAQQGRELARLVADGFPGPCPEIGVVLLPAAAAGARERFRPTLRALSRGRIRELAGRPGEALAGLHPVVSGLLGTSTARSLPRRGPGGESVETLILPPYLDSVVFDVLGEEAGAPIAIFAPGAADRPLAPGSQGVEETRLGQVLRTVAIRRPAPGTWTFRKPHPRARIEILSRQFFPRGELLAPAAGEPPRQHERAVIAYRVIDGDGAPVRELPGYPLRPEVFLRRPDGSRIHLAMERRPELGPAVFRTRDEAECDLPGRYWTEVAITTRDAGDRRVRVFADRWSGFSVDRASPIECRVVAPGSAVAVPFPRALLLLNQPIPTRFRCVDRTARPVEMAGLVKGSPAGLLHPSLLYEDVPTPAALDLRYLGQGVFQGSLRGAVRPGSYRLRLTVDEALLPARYNVRFLPDDVRFVRRLDWLHWAQLGLLLLGPLFGVAMSCAACRRRRGERALAAGRGSLKR